MPATRRSKRQAAAAATAAATAASVPTATTGGAAPKRSAAAKKASAKKAPPPSVPSSTHKRKKATTTPASKGGGGGGTTTTTPEKKKKKRTTGLKDAVDSSAPLGVVDPESNIEGGSIESLDGEPCDVMLALVDPSKNSDKFFVLQLIRTKLFSEFVVYTRWGRTGTAGQALEQDFDDLKDAVSCFEDKFEQKTGLTWKDRMKEPTKSNKYRFVAQNFAQKRAGYSGGHWQYWVDDGIDGKKTGWYDYTEDGSRQTERLYQECASNTNARNNIMSQRYVQSGAWTYNVDLVRMVQTNVTHPNRTSRHIRRCPAGVKMDDSPPGMMAPAANKNASKATIGSGSHPVDTDISVQGRSACDFYVVEGGGQDGGGDSSWYDVVLNQCNVEGNNNKYYRMQMLREKSGRRKFFIFCKWGRVGEQAKRSATSWLGPFDSAEDAHKPFAKKYKEKSGNAFGADPFVPKKGKYVPVEIDNDVEVDGKPQASGNPTLYAPSSLHPKTRELVEVLFSEDMRNEALSNFHIDLKKLPLGVPSEQQIRRGIDVLTDIELKLDVEDSVDESFAELSSRFYTTIPHSFGRARPPVIDDTSSLQERYDMCNILLDMYSTSETVRKIQRENASAAKRAPPCPADLHYRSLHADVTPLDKNTRDYKMIWQYFDLTKSPHSQSVLLDVFSVNRHSEAGRFEKYSRTGNRRLLWHGTNVAVVAPILTGGLRIMPHSGGRVGAGIYLAGMQEKSAQYTRGYGSKFACMFLCEAPLGRQLPVTSDGPHASGLREVPAGFDSVHAVGRVTPGKWGSMDIGGKDVQIPVSKPVQTKVPSSFHHDEFLVYDEAKVRIRYVLTVKL